MVKDALFYIHELEDLFKDIQLKRVFKDQKHFTDSVPNKDIPTIVSLYNSQKNNTDFDIKKFYEAHFQPTLVRSKHLFDKPAATAEEYIGKLWKSLIRMPEELGGTIIPLPKPFIVPGGRFNEIYYWDSYFTMLGLQVSGQIEMIDNMVENFAYMLDRFGFIPNGNRTYFLTRSQPPFFNMMVRLLAEVKGEEVFIKYLPHLQKQYNYWMSGDVMLSDTYTEHRHVVLVSGKYIFNRFWDDVNEPRPESYFEDIETAKEVLAENPEVYRNLRAAAESGWDFSSRWLTTNNLGSIITTHLVPLDLNCLIFNLEKTLAKAYAMAQDEATAGVYADKAAKRSAAISRFFWCGDENCFTDYNFKTNRHTGKITAAIVYPLFFKIASEDQAAGVAKIIEEKFLKPGGLVTTMQVSGQQWDAPNGWAPLQWMAYKGLKNYGFNGLANKIKTRWIKTVDDMFTAHHRIFEKYNVIDVDLPASGGEYENQDGFGWTNGVYLKFKSEE